LIVCRSIHVPAIGGAERNALGFETIEAEDVDAIEIGRHPLAVKWIDAAGLAEVVARGARVEAIFGQIVGAGEKGEVALDRISLTLHEGEILGIAGVAGNGQTELVEVITGLRKASGGQIIIFGNDMTNWSPKEIASLGVSNVPEERRRTGTAEGLSLAENLMMKDYRNSPFSKAGLLNMREIRNHCQKLVSEFEILTPDLEKTHARILSGGNIQRMILARELWKEPRLVITSHPTYGLDLRAIEHTHRLLLNLRQKGSAILLVSEDLDEILALSDRVAVMFNGKVIGIKESGKTNMQEIGLMMTGVT